MPVVISRNVEDYLKVIYKLGREGAPVSTSAIAAGMGVTMASATNMVKRLATMELVEHNPYRGVTLTTRGRRVALEVIRHHRLLELFLARHLGMGWDEVDREAERLEHVLSDELEDLIDRALGFPTSDPHGDPIPTKHGELVEEVQPLLPEVVPGRAVVRRVRAQAPADLRWLAERAIRPGAELNALEVLSGGDVRVRAGRRSVTVPAAIATLIHVEPLPAGGRPAPR